MVEGAVKTEKRRLVGTGVKLKEDLEALTAAARYTADMKLPNMLYAAIYRSPHAHARIVQVDLSRALELPGVVMGLTGKDIVDMVKPMAPFPFQSRDPFRVGNPTIQFFDHYFLATDKARFVGEAVAVIVATHRYIAEDALELIEAEFDPLPPITDPEAAMGESSERVYEPWRDNVMLRFHVEGGDLDKAFQEADLVVKERIKSTRFTGTPMETRAVVASYEVGTKQLTVWDATQIPHLINQLLHETLNRPELKIRVIAPRVGGGYGQKWGYYPEEGLIPLLSLLTQRPVKWVETRSEHMVATIHARDQVHYVEMAVKKDGTILGLRDRIIADIGIAYPVGGLAAIVTTAMFVPGAYKIQNYAAQLYGVVTNKTPFGPHRGFGKAEACYTIERMMDIIAHRLGIGPAEIRFRNFIQPEEFPYLCATGSRYDSGNYPAALQKAMDLADYSYWRREQERLRKEGRYLGIGVALVVEPSSSTRMGSYNAGYYSVTMRIDPSGKVYVLTGGNDEGQGHRTTISQLTADELGAAFDDITVLEGDSLLTPYGSGSYSSRFAVVGSSAVIMAARQLKEKVLRLASHLLGEPQDNLEVYQGRVYSLPRPDEGLTFRDIARVAYMSLYRLPPGMEPGLEVTYHHRDPNVTYQADEHGRVGMFSSFPYDADVAVVEVDVDTGKVKVLKYVSVHDCGNVINPVVVEGQHVGALLHGIGGALYEEIIYDENGQPLNANFKDYLVPTAQEVPPLTLSEIVTPNPFNPGGFKGAGETGTVGPPPTLANAVDDALRPLGVELRQVPLRPDYIWQEIRRARLKSSPVG
ncbi:MAG: xanthine dehydrogenase family protein molybdopterin-binding subunit [Chloroflexi bacterium]|nr:xanthine dehydrogenase family protein molybdopterin-binding subunit [Chloroflexota bacterium]